MPNEKTSAKPELNSLVASLITKKEEKRNNKKKQCYLDRISNPCNSLCVLAMKPLSAQ